MTNPVVLEAATLYVTNKLGFQQKFGDTLHKHYLDELFLNAATRPDLAETLTMTILGITPYYTKHGYDGHLTKRQVEVKVATTTIDDGRANSSFAAVSINDISQNIINKYDACRLHWHGLPAVACLTNNPVHLMSWFAGLPSMKVACVQGDAAGMKLAKYGDECVMLPAGKDVGDLTDDEFNELFGKYL